MESGPPRKFWSFDAQVSRLVAALRQLVEIEWPDRPWKTIWIALRKGAGITHTITLFDQAGGQETLVSTAEVDEIVSAIVAILQEPPRESWSVLNIEVWGKPPAASGSVISWGEGRAL